MKILDWIVNTLAKWLEPVVLTVIKKQMRPGGLLHDRHSSLDR